MDEFMNEEMKGKKWSSKEKTAKMINRKKRKKKEKKKTRPTNEACRPNDISLEVSPAMQQKTQQV